MTTTGRTPRRSRPQLSYRPKPGEIPTNPGVYRFRDAQGRVLYVGKAKNLRARLSNYFAPLHTLHERTRRMVTTATSVEWTVVATDVDSLQLEYQWIKEFDPPFNVRYRDDKSYPFMAVTLGDEAPRVMVTRNHRIAGAKYFGPYPKVWAVHDTIDLLIKVFPIRTCSDASYKKAMASGRPCFPGQIGRCGGPCSMKVTIDEHRAIVDDFVAFMAGGDQRFTREMTARMNEASAAMDYESAAMYRDKLQAIDAVLKRSALVLPADTDADLIVDTSRFNVHQLATHMVDLFSEEGAARHVVTVMSFGFKYGLPPDADLVADMRFLPNPYWNEQLRPLTGVDEDVRDYVLEQEGAVAFIDAYAAALRPVLEGYQRENKRHSVVAIGCTGGKHRSVVMARELAARLPEVAGVAVRVKDRDLGRE